MAAGLWKTLSARLRARTQGGGEGGGRQLWNMSEALDCLPSATTTISNRAYLQFVKRLGTRIFLLALIHTKHTVKMAGENITEKQPSWTRYPTQ